MRKKIEPQSGYMHRIYPGQLDTDGTTWCMVMCLNMFYGHGSHSLLWILILY